MFDENQLVEVKWNSNNIKHFKAKGYIFTKRSDTFKVFAKELQNKSSSKVKVTCDFCGKEYITSYACYTKGIERGKDCCVECKQKKRESTFIKHFGVNSPGASKICKEKAKQVMKERYGAEYAFQTNQGKESFKETMQRKYGYDNPSFCPEMMAKARFSMFKNGTVPVSKPERQVFQILCNLYGQENCYSGFPVDKVNLDCLLTIDNQKIDVEYDGWYWHQDTKDYDRKRNHWLMSKGYKILRILGNKKEEIPSAERLKEEVDYLLDNHSIGYIDMNN